MNINIPATHISLSSWAGEEGHSLPLLRSVLYQEKNEDLQIKIR